MLLLLTIGLFGVSLGEAVVEPPGADAPGVKSSGLAIRVERVLTMDDVDAIHEHGMLLVRGGTLEYVGAETELPAGYELLEYTECWAAPGMVDLHSHVQTGGWGDINDMVLPLNFEISTVPTFVPANASIRRACAAGVTTLFGIPGSGTVISGFGTIFKTKTDATFDEAVVAAPGGMKVAQTHNPERSAGDVGRTRAGLYWLAQHALKRAAAANASGEFDPALDNLQKVVSGELPVLIHCAGGHGVGSTVRLWHEEYATNCTVSHGSFNGYKLAQYVAEQGVPVNHGPRTADYRSTREGRIVGSGYEYWAAGVPNFSLNTDAPVVPQEELFLQGAMSARLGADGYQMLRAVTIHPARSIGIDERVGSLEVGKDADIVLWSGSPLDPRSRVELVLIDGTVQYDRLRDGQWF